MGGLYAISCFTEVSKHEVVDNRVNLYDSANGFIGQMQTTEWQRASDQVDGVSFQRILQ